MNRRQLFLSTAKAALLAAFGGSWVPGRAKAQPNPAAPTAASEGALSGTPGSPSSTISIDGRVLPPAPPAFGGAINESVKDSKPWWPPRIVPPAGAPNVLLIMTDDQGYGVSSTFGGVIPTPALDRVANAGLRYTQFHSTALCSPTRAALITGRNHHAVGFGVVSEISTATPAMIPTLAATMRRSGGSSASTATPPLGSARTTTRRGPSSAWSGPFDQWPSGMGFQYFYGFMGECGMFP